MTARSNPVSGRFFDPSEYDIARRFRHKLLLSYLFHERLYPTFESMVEQTDAHMCGDHLRRLVSRGQWGEALGYLARFNARKTVASNALHFFLHTFLALANVAAGATDGSVESGAHQHGMALSTVICRCPKLWSIVKGMLASPQQCASLDWKLTRIRAAETAYFLAREDPDLKSLMQLPGDGQSSLPYHALHISPCPRRRRHLKRPPGRRAPGPAIARVYLSKRRSLHSSTPRTPDKCIKAGKRQKQLQSSGRVPDLLMPLQTAPGVPFFQTSSRITSVPNPGAPASSQIMSGTFTKQAKNSGISSEQNSACQDP